MTIVLTDRSTEMTGTVRDARNAPMPAHHRDRVLDRSAVLARAVAPHPGGRGPMRPARSACAASRRRLLLVAVDDVEQGEWFDPAYLEQARARRDPRSRSVRGRRRRRICRSSCPAPHSQPDQPARSPAARRGTPARTATACGRGWTAGPSALPSRRTSGLPRRRSACPSSRWPRRCSQVRMLPRDAGRDSGRSR